MTFVGLAKHHKGFKVPYVMSFQQSSHCSGMTHNAFISMLRLEVEISSKPGDAITSLNHLKDTVSHLNLLS